MLWIVAVLIFVRATTQPAPEQPMAAPPQASAGADLFGQHCARCHEASRIARTWREADDREAAADTFRTFLLKHHGPSPEGNAAIVQYVLDVGQ